MELTQDNLLTSIKRISEERFKINQESITLESRFDEDLDLDSLDAVELIMEIEKEYSLIIPDHVTEAASTGTVSNLINDIINYFN